MRLPLPGFSHFLRHPRCTCARYLRGSNSLTPSHAHFSSVPKTLRFRYGDYAIIFPPEPIQLGISHLNILPVPASIPRPQYVIERQRRLDAGENDAEINDAGDLDPYDGDGRIKLGGEEEERLRRTAELAKKVREFAGSLVKVGVTTSAIDSAIHNFIIAHDAYPSPRLYSGFPRSCCTSVNNIIAHGIPDDRRLRSGDIINIDITVFKDGYHGDTSKTFLVGDVDSKGERLVRTTLEALEAGVKSCGPGRPFNGIGKAIHVVAVRNGYSVSSQFTGHGIGKVFHRPPWIIHNLNEEPGVMLPGHCFTVEPCLVQGYNPNGWIFPDGWTASTLSCARSSQEEHMVLITETGADILTR